MIKYEISDEIGILTLNRPEKRNALNAELARQLRSQLILAEKDDSIKVVIITGEGKAFCAGADLEYLNKMREYSSLKNESDSRELAELFKLIYDFPKPVIAAVNGAAIAGGCGLASVCDFIIADVNNSKFGYTEVKIGFLPAIVSTFIIRRVGEGLAKQLLISGEIIEAKRAYEIGFVNHLSDNVLEFSLELASKLKTSSQLSVRMCKEMIKKVSRLSVDDAIEYCIGLNTISRTTDDFKTGLKNFLNKK